MNTNSFTYLLTYLLTYLYCAPYQKTEDASQSQSVSWRRRQNETEMFLDHDETSPSIVAVSAPSVACSMLAVQQQKRLVSCAHWRIG